jgi:hypothetical protein
LPAFALIFLVEAGRVGWPVDRSVFAASVPSVEPIVRATFTRRLCSVFVDLLVRFDFISILFSRMLDEPEA